MKEEKEKLISIEELITKAKAFGVDFGNGDPKNRLRYYVKIGLLPHAQRKSFNGLPPQGCFPLEALSTLITIDRKIKEGKSILQIKREVEELKDKEKILKTEEKHLPTTTTLYPSRIEVLAQKAFTEFLKPTEETEALEIKKERPKIEIKKFFQKNFSLIFLSVFVILVFYFAAIFAKDYFLKMTAALPGLDRFFKKIETPTQLVEKAKEVFALPPVEPYLTINVDTDILGRLTLKKSLLFETNGYEAMFDFEKISQNRIYTFPDASGTVCLTTGNCAMLYGDVKTPGGIINRLAKFSEEKEISASSILDNFLAGVSIFIDEKGNVGIGNQAPQAKVDIFGPFRVTGQTNLIGNLNVTGTIQATGDVCTDEAGGKCLSKMITWFYGGAGISGSGDQNYLAMWGTGNTLTQSIIYQSGNLLGINLTNPNEVLTISGALSLAKTTEPGVTASFGKIFVGQNGKLYYKNEFGTVYDLTLIGNAVSGQGERGQVAFWNSASEVLGTNDLFWDIENKRLGIRNPAPQYALDVTGDINLPTNGFLRIGGNPGVEGQYLRRTATGLAWTTIPVITSGNQEGQVLRWNALSGNWEPTSHLLILADGKIGIGTIPTQQLDVAGVIKTLGFHLPSGAQSGYVLTSDGSGYASWQPPPTGTIPAGQLGYTLWHDGAGWVATNFLYNDGTRIGIGGTSTDAILTVLSTNLAQLLLKHDNNNFLKFSISTSSSEILSSKNLILNSATGEIKFWGTSLRKGEYIFRASLPVFKYPIPAQTNSTTFAPATKEISISELNNSLPQALPGSQRKIAFLLNFSDTIPQTASSTWQIDYQTGQDIEFIFQGQNLTDLEEGVAHLSPFYDFPSANWTLKVKVPNSAYKIRIFNIFLIVVDQIQ